MKKVGNVGEMVVVNVINSFLPLRIMYGVMTLEIDDLATKNLATKTSIIPWIQRARGCYHRAN